MTRAGLIAAVALAATGCGGGAKKQPEARTNAASRPATARRAPSLPRVGPQIAPSTAAERRFDGARRARMDRVLFNLKQSLEDWRRVAKKGSADPAYRRRWTATREAVLEGVGRVRAVVLKVDPLGDRSWVCQQARIMLHFLTVKIPDAVLESWSSRPSGALDSFVKDFLLIWRRVRRYVNRLPSASIDDPMTPRPRARRRAPSSDPRPRVRPLERP